MNTTSKSSSQLMDLPPELRIRIYEYALQFQTILEKPLRASAWRDFTGYLANISLLATCKLIHKEAKDVFYEVNRFRISYNHMCYCVNRYPYEAFGGRVQELGINGFLPRVDEENTCRFCRDGGYGLLEYLIKLPKLKAACIAFEDIFSFSDFAPEMLRGLSNNYQITLHSRDVGIIGIQGLSVNIVLQLPSLARAWAALGERGGKRTSDYRLPGEKTMRGALEYLQFEANAYDRTAAALLPFFVPLSEDDESRTLRFDDVLDGTKRRAEFTIALTGVLNVIFEDEGGANSIQGADIPGPLYGGRRWRFEEESEQSAPTLSGYQALMAGNTSMDDFMVPTDPGSSAGRNGTA